MRYLFFIVIVFITASSHSQNIGIGTTIPAALLHVALDTPNSINNGFLITGYSSASATVPNFGPGSRLMFYPGKGAFRAGYANNNAWDNVNVGKFSTALGYATTALGEGSIATGDGTSAYTKGSVAFGLSNKAKGFASTVIGMYNDTLLFNNETAASLSTPLFIIGNGNSGVQRSNAMVVRKSGDVEIVGNLTVQNGKGLIRTNDGVQWKKLSTTVNVNATFAAGETKIFNISFPESFSAIPEAYIGNIINGSGGFAQVIMTISNVTPTSGVLNVFNPTTSFLAPNYTVKIIAMGVQ